MKQISQDPLIGQLRAVVTREQVLCEPEELLVYECDGLTQHKFPPRAVVFPRTTEEVAAVIRVLARERVPFAPRGAGTGLSGGALAVNRGVVIELARMRRLLKVDVENRLAIVETGMVNAQLSRAVLPYGLYYVPDPSSQATCTIGGNIAENAGGIHCLKYGMTVDHVTAARVVLSNGEIIELGNTGGAGAGAGDYDLLGLFVGSEGTFGIATEATVRLTPIPPAVRTLLADFTDVDDASRAVSAIIAEGLIPAALEMVDGATIRAVEASIFAAGLPLDAEAALLVELDGLEAGLDDEAARCEKICRANGARGVRHAKDEDERKKLWAARKGAFGAMGRISPDLMLQDAVVPRSRLPEVLAATYRIAAKYNLRIANVFHAGDGNLHPFICFDARDHDEVLRVKEAGREMMETCVRAGGTITGEHGVGMDKSDYLPMIFSEDDLDAMRRVRAAFDPLGICNPGKIIPAPLGCGEARAVAMQTEARARLSKTGFTDDSNGHQNVSSPHSAPLHETTESSLAAAESLSTDRERERQPGQSVQIHESVRAPSPMIHHSLFKVDVASQLCARIVGAAHVSGLKSASDIITVAPASTEEACEVLRLASSEGWSVVPAGARTWLDGDGTWRGGNVIITTERLTQIIEHEPADLVATAQAGVTLTDFNRVTGDAGQWLPLDPPDDGRATIGGVAACGLGGAQSLGYGLPRGHVLGMRVALADGRVVKAGGRVVKNVAGYDMCKLFVGSRGTLGVILELTFKLRPRPAREATVVARAVDYESLLTVAHAVIASELLPVAVELLSPRMAAAVGVIVDEHEHALLIRFAGAERTVDYQIARAHELCKVPSSHVEAMDNDAHLWKNLAAVPLNQESFLVWRASVQPSELSTMLNKIHVGESGLRRDTALWQVGIGDGRLRVIECDETKLTESISFIKKLSSKVNEGGGSLIVENAPFAIKEAFDSCGAGGGTAELMQRIKHQLDPQNLFSPDACTQQRLNR